MKLYRTDTFKKNYKKLPQSIKKATRKQLELLLANPDHPSLNIKKMQGVQNIWECRITKSYRFTFHKSEDAYILRKIGTHDILNKP